MEKLKIKAVEMVRQIRDQNYEELKGKTHQEIIALYNKKAAAFHAKLKRLKESEKKTTVGR